MNFKQFLIENSLTELGEKGAAAVISDCGPFLQQISGKVYKYELFRGMTSDEQMIHKSVRLDRKPKDTPQIIHELVNGWFVEEFSTRYRAGALFCTGSPGDALEYGNLYQVYPVGPIRCCWSPKVNDLWTHLENTLPRRQVLDFNNKSKIEIKPIIDEILEDADYQEGDLKAAILSRNEIMIDCDSYYAFRDEHEGGLTTANVVTSSIMKNLALNKTRK